MLEHEKPIFECEQTINELKEQNEKNDSFAEVEIQKLEAKLQELKHKVYSSLTPWQRVSICRHPNRPHSIDYVREVFDEFEELFGDRNFRDDPAVIGGLGIIDSQKFVVIAQEKGSDTESRIQRNFGMPHPEGYRKAKRLMKLAEKFHLPVITFIDTPGAYPGLAAEERGQGWAIAENLYEMAQLETPIICVLIGEGCSGGALGIGVGDMIGMLEHSYYSVISPEGCASILYKDASKNDVAAACLKLLAEDLKENGIIEEIIKEPEGGAHHDPKQVFHNVKEFILRAYEALSTLDTHHLVERRYQKYRKIGAVEEFSSN